MIPKEDLRKLREVNLQKVIDREKQIIRLNLKYPLELQTFERCSNAHLLSRDLVAHSLGVNTDKKVSGS